MRLAIVQTNPVFGEVELNVRSALNLMRSTPADLYVLPELFNTGYNFIDGVEVSRLAESTSGPTFQSVAEFARDQACHVVYGFAESAGRIYNSAALVGPGGFMGLYRKVHLFDREHLFFTPGDLGFRVFNLPFGNVGLMICFDWIYPEAARTLALKGAHLIVHPSNLVLPYCPDAMVTRCVENRVFAATADRVGREDRGGVDLRFIGKSEIVSPRGEILGRLGADEVGILVMGLDLHEADFKKLTGYNDLLVDRRPEQYSA
ncbi:MAG: acyltransferase [Ignavibacteria bacterium]|nr:acyltransferase [Ignavibacteria bacterium]